MALTLHGLNRAVGAVSAASPKVLGAITPKTPKTPAFSPFARGAASVLPLPTEAFSFGDLQTTTPKALGRATPSFMRHAHVSAAAQRDLAEVARPYAEVAHKYHLARCNRDHPAAAATSNRPTLLGGRGFKAGDNVGSITSDPLPVLLGRSETSVSTPPTAKSVRFEFEPHQAARDARDMFMARQQQIKSRGASLRVP